jgi:hypothetical protein
MLPEWTPLQSRNRLLNVAIHDVFSFLALLPAREDTGLCRVSKLITDPPAPQQALQDGLIHYHQKPQGKTFGIIRDAA